MATNPSIATLEVVAGGAPLATPRGVGSPGGVRPPPGAPERLSRLLGAYEARGEFSDCHHNFRWLLLGSSNSISALPIHAADSYLARYIAGRQWHGNTESVRRAALRRPDAADRKAAIGCWQAGTFRSSLVRDPVVRCWWHLSGCGRERAGEPARGPHACVLLIPLHPAQTEDTVMYGSAVFT